MAIIKAPPKQPKSVTIQARVEESVKMQLDQYAKFIDSTPSYVITEALKVLFKRDDEFKSWLGQHVNGSEFRTESRRGSHEDRITDHEVPSNPIRCAREYSVVETACLAPYSGFVTSDVRSSPERFAISRADSSFGIPCKRAGRVDYYNAAGRGHRRREERSCRNFFRSWNGYYCQRVETSTAAAGAICLGRRGGAVSMCQTSLSVGART